MRLASNWQTKAFKHDRFDVVVKVGGSVVYGEALDTAAKALAEVGSRRRIIAFPGGGQPDVLFEEIFAAGRLSSPGLVTTSELAQDQTAVALADPTAATGIR